MPDSQKSTIVIASVLKPVDDSRLYEKIAQTLACTGQFQIHIIGCASAGSQNSKVHQHPFKPFRRISLRRFFAPWLILSKALSLKPDIFIIATHELLYTALIVKMIKGCRVIYDVQENYYWNILYTNAFPLLLKPFVAFYVRGKETLLARYVDHFFLAERGYEQELKFPAQRYTVLENKVRAVPAEHKLREVVSSRNVIRLLFSGTIAETTGVFTAIDLAVKLHVIDERIRLTLIGFCAQPSVLEKIRMLIRPRSFIELITSDRPIAHQEIFERIRKADFGLITYQINPSTTNSIPTKLYEYLGFHLPIILVNHKPWVEFCRPYNAAVVFDSAHYDTGQIYQAMMSSDFYTDEPVDVYWEMEEAKLLGAIGGLTGIRH